MGREQLERALRELEPLRQGALDGLCSLYAIVNAIRLVVHPYRPLRKPQLRQLFECGLVSLSRRRVLRHAITHGTSDRLWHQLCDDVVFEAAMMTGLEMVALPLFETSTPPPPPAEALRLIRHSIRDGWPVLLALMDALNHRTVVAGFSRTRLTLFDSAGLRWVWVRSLSFDPALVGDPHFVPLSSVVTLSAF